MLLEGDYVQAVGSEEALNQFAVLVGEREEGELPLDQTQEIESLLLTKKDMINKQLGDLNLQRELWLYGNPYPSKRHRLVTFSGFGLEIR